MVSVIVPVYNAEPYLAECVESILRQTYRDFELILVDDGSTDASGRMCDDFARRDPRIRVIHKPNGGVSSARNAGLDVACGEYVSFVDSDDILHRRFLEIMVSHIPAKRMIMCNRKCFSVAPSSEEIREPFPAEIPLKLKEPLSPPETNVCLKLFEKTVFDDLRFKEGRIYEDLLISPYYFLKCDGKMSLLPITLYYYRTRHDSLSNAQAYFRKKYLDFTYCAIDRCKFYRTIYPNYTYMLNAFRDARGSLVQFMRYGGGVGTMIGYIKQVRRIWRQDIMKNDRTVGEFFLFYTPHLYKILVWLRNVRQRTLRNNQL